MNNQRVLTENPAHVLLFGVQQRSDQLMNYFLSAYFLLGLVLATFYETWLIAFGIGGILLLAYYSIKIALPCTDC